MKILVLQHSPDGGPLRLGEWLIEAGASLDVRRLYDGDGVPADVDGFDALVSLGGPMSAWDDDSVGWLSATKSLLAAAVADRTPTLAICLGAQLLAAATGGMVEPGDHGGEYGAYLTAKRDAAERDPLFGWLPMTPDVMQSHRDVITELPPDAVLLLTGTGYENQAFRVGEAAWGIQFHIETPAKTLREWAAGKGSARRLGAALDEAEANMAEVWSEFARRFVNLRPRLPVIGR